jgi:hypothetical protein
MMPPPPPPESSRAARVQGGSGTFKPSASGRTPHPPNPQSNTLSSRASSQRSDQNQPVVRDRRQMGPPTPQVSAQASNRTTFTPLTAQSQARPEASYPRIQTASFASVADLQPSMSSARFAGSSSNNRFIPPLVNINPNPGNQRFVPPTPTNGSQQLVAPGLKTLSRATNGSHTASGRGGQRMPFVPRSTQGGFG